MPATSSSSTTSPSPRPPPPFSSSSWSSSFSSATSSLSSSSSPVVDDRLRELAEGRSTGRGEMALPLLQDADGGREAPVPLPPSRTESSCSSSSGSGSGGGGHCIGGGGTGSSDDLEYNGVETARTTTITTATTTVTTERSWIWDEAKTLVWDLAIPTVLIQWGISAPPFVTSSWIGRRFGSLYLDGYTLCNLTVNLSTLSVLQGLYSATDTLSPQAHGASNYREVGVLAVRGFLTSLVVVVPASASLLLFMPSIMPRFGQNPRVVDMAYRFYAVDVLSLPFYALYVVTWKFLSTQNIMTPLLVAVFVSCAVVLPLSLRLFAAGGPDDDDPDAGYVGAAFAIVVYQAFQALSLLGYVCWNKPHHPGTWPADLRLGTSIREAMRWNSLSTYLTLAAGGMLANLEWVYWETVSLVVGSMGVVPLSVHAIPVQVIVVLSMIPLGIGIALSVRIGSLVSNRVKRAKTLALLCWIGTVALVGIISLALYLSRRSVYGIFTSDELVRAGCERIWIDVCLHSFFVGVYQVNVGVATGLGMQWWLGLTTVLCLWCVGFPLLYYHAVVAVNDDRHPPTDGHETATTTAGVEAVWSWIWTPYLIMNAILMISFSYGKDWEEVSSLVRLRDGAASFEEIDDLRLLATTDDDDLDVYNDTGTQSDPNGIGNRATRTNYGSASDRGEGNGVVGSTTTTSSRITGNTGTAAVSHRGDRDRRRRRVPRREQRQPQGGEEGAAPLLL